MNPIFAAALEVQRFLEEREWRFCFIGGVAVLRWGEPRVTQDVDLTLITGFGGEQPFVDVLLERFESRLAEAATFALRNRVVLLRASNGIPIDVALGALPFEDRAVGRSSPFPVDEQDSITTCSAEDLIVFKVFAGRSRDWADVEGVVARRAGHLDEELIMRELGPLLELKGAPQEAQRIEHLLAR